MTFHRHCDRCLVVAVLLFCASLAPAAEPSPNEQQPLAVLRSDAPEAEKAAACKRLAVVGTAASAADLAALLSNEHLA